MNNKFQIHTKNKIILTEQGIFSNETEFDREDINVITFKVNK